MEIFLSKKDKSFLLVMDSVSKAGNVFKVVSGETWKLVWSGLVTEDFLKSPDWEWAASQHDPAHFPGGWPKPE